MSQSMQQSMPQTPSTSPSKFSGEAPSLKITISLIYHEHDFFASYSLQSHHISCTVRLQTMGLNIQLRIRNWPYPCTRDNLRKWYDKSDYLEDNLRNWFFEMHKVRELSSRIVFSMPGSHVCPFLPFMLLTYSYKNEAYGNNSSTFIYIHLHIYNLVNA